MAGPRGGRRRCESHPRGPPLRPTAPLPLQRPPPPLASILGPPPFSPRDPPRDPPRSSRAPRGGQARVRPTVSFKDAVLSPPPWPSPPVSRPRRPNPALPLHPPKFLLNPSLVGRCFRCFERGHRAASCREPRRCLLCMEFGHPAARCSGQGRATRSTLEPEATHGRPRSALCSSLEPGPSSGRPRSAKAFLPPRPQLPGSSPILVAKVDISGFQTDFVLEALPRGLASRFGGTSSDYKLASFRTSSMAVFFPNWVVRESAVGHSPLRFDNALFHFSHWEEVAELERGHLRHKAWIKLLRWPLLCWDIEDVKAAVAGFGELWEVDRGSACREDVSAFRALIRC